jgi:hypothetical protein
MTKNLQWNKTLLVKKVSSAILAAIFLCSTAPASKADTTNQVMQGTQIHLTLLNGINTSLAKDGDPFVAIVTEPVMLGTQTLIPAGTRVNGVIGTVEKAKKFSVFRGQAYMNVTFRTMEVDSRLVPIRMSLISFETPRGSGSGDGKQRKDVKVAEGQVVQEKHDFKGDIVGATIGTGAGSIVGAIFGKVVQGFGFGLAGSAAYIMIRKGKEVELPAQTGMLVRMDNTVMVPVVAASNAAPSNGNQ